mmetsp:Transcript_12551/g.34716  ORF Transcript_12551/g.34716 Transcript_12551/m.34716 type:complete len:313 (+) Transcript_12551:282-1220(+)
MRLRSQARELHPRKPRVFSSDVLVQGLKLVVVVRVVDLDVEASVLPHHVREPTRKQRHLRGHFLYRGIAQHLQRLGAQLPQMPVLGDALGGAASCEHHASFSFLPHVVLPSSLRAVALEVGVPKGNDVLPAGLLPLVEILQLFAYGLGLHPDPKLLHLFRCFEFVPFRILRRQSVGDVLLRVNNLEVVHVDNLAETRQKVLHRGIDPRSPCERHDEAISQLRRLLEEKFSPVQELCQQTLDDGPPPPLAFQLLIQGKPPVHATIVAHPSGWKNCVVPVQDQRGVVLLSVPSLAIPPAWCHRGEQVARRTNRV